MPRRIWLVLLIVVAVLAIAPHLPQWWPAAVTAVREFDYAALGHNIVAGAQVAIDFAVQHPQSVGGVGGGILLVTIGALVVKGRAPRARHVAAVEATIPVAGAYEGRLDLGRAAAPDAQRAPLPGRFNGVPIQVPVIATAPVIVTAPPVGTAEPSRIPNRRTAAGRGSAVRRLSLAGHSTAEIARATRVGQDAVRLVLHRRSRP